MVALGAALVAGALASCGSAASGPRAPVVVDGAGSTSGERAWREFGSRLFLDFGWIVRFQAVAARSAVARVRAGTADFAGTEFGPAGDHAGVRRFPVAVGAVVVAYRLPGIAGGLNLSASSLAAICLGRITRWDDPAIARDNPRVRLPALPIVVVHRSDPSATTLAFTRYLTNHSTAWATQVGAGQSVRWPVGSGVGGNTAVAATVEGRPGAIGFVELAYALDNDMTFGDLPNRSGRFMAPTAASVAAPLYDLRGRGALPPLLDVHDRNAYPLDLPIWMALPHDVCAGGRGRVVGRALKTIADYALGKGQGIVNQLYASLPEPWLGRAKAVVRGLRCHGRPAPTRYVPVKPPAPQL